MSKELPILFQGAMIRALLADTKTQTRRVAGLHVINAEPDRYDYLGIVSGPAEPHYAFHDKLAGAQVLVRCRSGQRGDRLWVRENGWERPFRTAKMMREGADTWAPYYFDADGITEQDAADFKAWGFKRRPSIHMPRVASRILLEVTAVRVERLQAISEADALSEGIVAHRKGGWHVEQPPQGIEGTNHFGFKTARDAYRVLWESINPPTIPLLDEDGRTIGRQLNPARWEANPWVWVVSFRRITP
jgi:hypothetical protein